MWTRRARRKRMWTRRARRKRMWTRRARRKRRLEEEEAQYAVTTVFMLEFVIT